MFGVVRASGRGLSARDRTDTHNMNAVIDTGRERILLKRTRREVVCDTRICFAYSQRSLAFFERDSWRRPIALNRHKYHRHFRHAVAILHCRRGLRARVRMHDLFLAENWNR